MINQTPSSLLSHRYKVLGLLGDGGFGKTFLVEDTQIPSNRRCVVKQLKPIHDNPQIHQIVKDRFQREAAILERLGDGHDQIPQLYAYFSEDEQFYLVEEWVEGDTLAQKVQNEGIQSEATVRSILMKLLPTIAYVHRQQIVHRDIKPDNVILRRRDSQPVLIDFGAVKESMSTIVNSQGNSTNSIVVGTPGYMPAEQLAGRPVFASDIYSLGMTAIYLLTGRIPQQLDTNPMNGELSWQQYAPSITSEFAAIINKSVQMSAHLRFATAVEMLSALQASSVAATIPPTVAPPITPPPIPAPSDIHTQAIASIPTQNSQPVSVAAAPSGEWKRSVMIGCIIGLSILGGAFMLRSQLPGTTIASNPTPSTSPTPSVSPPTTQLKETPAQPLNNNPQPTAPDPAPAKPQQPQVPSASEGNQNGDSNASIIDKDSSTNVRSGAGTNNPVTYTARSGDRVFISDSALDSGGYRWYSVRFAKSGVTGWVASQLLKLDPIAQPDPPQNPNPPKTDDTNAILVGEAGSKNIRSGPGTKFSTLHMAYPGDRVRILETAQDAGGYTWYKVYFPKSGADGWIAAQLVKVD
ncbi:serine/threonine protein kinase [Leptolyngbya sp. NIES-2104]|uniref:serine/threonine protein kinase n=1 Tax=Leptolyngbya sp. NIES-2104 TaxID=1552121 RepID=UPI0006ECAD57|nr:serine/threonine protein kinase [Leptolyngbya sp. NIES-2104]GAP97504.1 serine/threonine kinase [Leptolyngbya sp. NIES-2104]